MKELQSGDRVLTFWGLPAVVEAVKPAPYLAFPDSQRIVVVKMETGERHDLLRDSLSEMEA